MVDGVFTYFAVGVCSPVSMPSIRSTFLWPITFIHIWTVLAAGRVISRSFSCGAICKCRRALWTQCKLASSCHSVQNVATTILVRVTLRDTVQFTQGDCGVTPGWCCWSRTKVKNLSFHGKDEVILESIRGIIASSPAPNGLRFLKTNQSGIKDVALWTLAINMEIETNMATKTMRNYYMWVQAEFSVVWVVLTKLHDLWWNLRQRVSSFQAHDRHQRSVPRASCNVCVCLHHTVNLEEITRQPSWLGGTAGLGVAFLFVPKFDTQLQGSFFRNPVMKFCVLKSLGFTCRLWVASTDSPSLFGAPVEIGVHIQ